MLSQKEIKMFNMFKKNVKKEETSNVLLIKIINTINFFLKDERKLKLDCSAIQTFPPLIIATVSFYFMSQKEVWLQLGMMIPFLATIMLTEKWAKQYYIKKITQNMYFLTMKDILENLEHQLEIIHQIDVTKEKFGKDNTDNIIYQLKKLFLNIHERQLKVEDINELQKIIISYHSIGNNKEDLYAIAKEYDKYVIKKNLQEKELEINELKKYL